MAYTTTSSGRRSRGRTSFELGFLNEDESGDSFYSDSGSEYVRSNGDSKDRVGLGLSDGDRDSGERKSKKAKNLNLIICFTCKIIQFPFRIYILLLHLLLK